MSKWASQVPFHTHEQGHIVGHMKSPNLDVIAAEIYLKIIEHLHTARDLASLSETCRRSRDLIGRDGWRIFVQINFPSLIRELPPGIENCSTEWRDLARSLTTQSRAWDRRAISTASLNAGSRQVLRLVNAFQSDIEFEQFISKKGMTYCLLQWDQSSKRLSSFRISEELPLDQPAEAHRPSSSQRQTTPFHPAIDTRLEFSGKLSSKKQTVAWSTGPEVFIQVRRSGPFLPRPEDDPYDHCPTSDEYSNRLNWFTVQHDEFRAGADDVTSINILDPCTPVRESLPDTLAVDFIAGRASGHLHRYSVSNAEPVRVVVNTFRSFEKQGSPSRCSVRSADVNSKTGASLLVACSDKVISLYKTEVETHDVWPVAEIEIELNLPRAQAWNIKFSTHENLLLGLGQSPWPLYAYQASPTGLVLTEKLGDQCDISDMLELTSRSVYAIEPLSGCSRTGGSSNGDVFLSGCYDGVCRLYDRRAGCSPVRSFYDPVDTESAIYSLISFGQERFLAGSANSKLKIFDFRNSSKVYHYTDGLKCSTNFPIPQPFISSQPGKDTPAIRSSRYPPVEDCHHDYRTDTPRTCHFHTLSRMDIHRRNTSIFLYGTPRLLNPHTRAVSRHENSPIFSLSSPDPICPVVYAGTTGTVYELEISEMDQASNLLDPYFAAPQGAGLAKHTQELSMYEMDGCDSTELTGSTPDSLWVLPQGRRIRNPILSMNESRLDTRWRSRHDTGWVV